MPSPFAPRPGIATSPPSALPDPWEIAAAEFEPPPPHDTDPPLWVEDRLGEFLWSVQGEVAHSVVSERYTAVPSCHNAGKSFIASRIAAWWIDVHPPGEAFVVSTAPTSAQVSAILWREITKAHKKGGLRGSIVSAGYPQWKIEGGELVGYGRKPADYSESAFQGIHARYVLIIMDEAGGVDKSLFDAVDALATNENARVLAIGNPDDPSSHFASICKPDSGWNVIRIDGLRTPNFTQEGVEWLDCPQCRKIGAKENLLTRLFREEGLSYSTEPVPDSIRPMLLSPLWVEERLHRWVGRATEEQRLADLAVTSSLFTAKVRGIFPDSNTEGIIPLGWVERAVDRGRELKARGQTPNGRRVVGADIAREGADETVLAIRHGNAITDIRKRRHADTMETTGYITALLNQPHALPVVDVIGVGAGVVDRLREMGQPVRPFNAAHSAKGMKDRSGEFEFMNLRAAAWWNLREMLDPSRGFDVALPDSEILKADLTTPRWKVLSGGKIQIETKDEIRKRIGRSTDEGDAVVMSFWVDSSVVGGAAEDPDVVDWWDGLDDSVLSWGIEGLAR